MTTSGFRNQLQQWLRRGWPLLFVPMLMPFGCPPPPIPVASFSPASLTFPPQVVSPGAPASGPQEVTLKNVGHGNLSTSGLLTSGDYSQTNDCPPSLPPSASCHIQVSFSPNAIGTINGAITIMAASVSLSGVGLAPAGFSPSTLDFGTVAPGVSSTPQTVTLTNNQTVALVISGISASGNYSEANNCPGSLPAAGSCNIDVTFTPTLSGQIPGALTVLSDAALAAQAVGLTGTGSGAIFPNVSFSPGRLVFGDLEAGTSSGPRTVTLTNTSATSTLSVNSIDLPGQPYTKTDNCTGQMVPPGGNCTIDVTFQPGADFAPLSFPGAITVSDSDSTSPQVVGLEGTAVAPVSATPDEVQFGTVFIGTRNAQLVTITNNHDTAQELAIGIGGNYSLDSNNCPGNLEAGGQCDLTVVAGGKTGVTRGAITLTPSIGGFLSPHVVSLSACGTSVLTIPPKGLNFGAVATGTTSDPQVASITNGGQSPLNLAGVSITGADASQFAISRNTCGTVLPAGQSCIVESTFTPTAVGDRSAALEISDDADCSPQRINLAGGSAAGPFTVTLAMTGDGSGTVTSDPAGINCTAGPCSATFPSGTPVTLTATPDGGVPFTGWFGSCIGTGLCTLDMAADKQVTAVFGSKPSLSVVLDGNATGTVTSSPPGIDCGNTCAETLDPGTAVTLAATPAAGSTFAGWSYACTGTSDCRLTVLSSQGVGATFTTPDFSLGAESPVPATITAGKSAIAKVVISSLYGFNSNVSLSCSVDPSPNLAPTCSLDPTSATPAPDGSVNSTLTISTAAPRASTTPYLFGTPGLTYALWLPVAGFAWFGVAIAWRQGSRSKQGRLLGSFLCLALSAGIVFQVACGGASERRPVAGGTPAGGYTISITGSSGSLPQHTTSVVLAVQ